MILSEQAQSDLAGHAPGCYSALVRCAEQACEAANRSPGLAREILEITAVALGMREEEIMLESGQKDALPRLSEVEIAPSSNDDHDRDEQ